MSDTTHHSTISAEVRRILDNCDLGGMNEQFFLKNTFVDDLAIFIQHKEAEAFQRGMHAARTTQSK